MEFQSEGAMFLPVLECSVKAYSYAVFARTVATYIEHPDDNLVALDWRIQDPSNIEINYIFVRQETTGSRYREGEDDRFLGYISTLSKRLYSHSLTSLISHHHSFRSH